MDGKPNTGSDPLSRSEPAANGSPNGAGPAGSRVPGEQEPPAGTSADRGAATAAGPGTDTTGPQAREPEDEPGKDAAAAAGEEYAERSRAGVTTVYVNDNRRYGVYAEGTVHARDIAGHDKMSCPAFSGQAICG